MDTDAQKTYVVDKMQGDDPIDSLIGVTSWAFQGPFLVFTLTDGQVVIWQMDATQSIVIAQSPS
jgi:hypothetical protein